MYFPFREAYCTFGVKYKYVNWDAAILMLMLPSPPSLVYLSRLSSHSSLSFFPWLAEGEVHYVLPVPRFCGWHSRFLLSIVDHPSERSYLCCFHSRTIQKLFSVFKWCEERKIKGSNTSLRLQVAKRDHLRKNINSVIIYSPQCCCFFLPVEHKGRYYEECW